jgi:hypothetical protein
MKRVGFECRVVGNQTLHISTPFTFMDGEPISFYLDDTGVSVRISDNSETLAHFAAIGYDISDRKRWRSIKQTVEAFGFSMLDTGEIIGSDSKQVEDSLITRYLSALLAVVDYEREYLGLPEELEQFIQEVEMYLRAWKPQAKLEHYPVVIGHSGRPHNFHFEFDRQLMDAARPHGIRTGSILRKAADVINAGDKRKIVVVMDDRADIERARVESDILSTMVSVMPFTRLVAQASGNVRPT